MTRAEWGLWLTAILVASVVAVTMGPLPTGDTPRYLALAASLREGLGFSIEEGGRREPEGFRMPGYPFWLAVAGTLAPGREGVVTVAAQQAGILLALMLAAAATRRSLGGSHPALLLALAVVYPFLPATACLLSPDAFTAPLVAGMWLLLCRPDPARSAMAGVLIAAGTYLRPNLLVLAPAAALALVVGKTSRRPMSVVALVLGCLGGLAPWSARNYAAFGSLSPLPPVGAYGRVLLVGTWEARVPVRDLEAYMRTGNFTAPAIAAGIQDEIRSANLRIGVSTDTVAVLERYPGNELRERANQVFRDQALRNIRERPWAYARRVAVRAVRMWFSAAVPAGSPQWVSATQLVLLAWGMVVAVAGLAGAVLAGARFGSSPGTQIGIAVLAALVGTLCWAHTEARYTIPGRLILMAFATLPVSALLSALMNHQRRHRGSRVALG